MQNHQADSPLYVWPDVWSADLHLFIENMVIHDIECPYWDQMLLNNTNQITMAGQKHNLFGVRCSDRLDVLLAGWGVDIYLFYIT